MSAPKLLLTVEEAGARLSVGRTATFDLIRSGQLQSVKIGRSRRVVAESVEKYVRRLCADQLGGAA